MSKGTIFIADSRNMAEVKDESIHLIVTSPPYWHIKDYGVDGQVGYGQTLHEYLYDLSRVWQEAWRVLRPGRRLCINIGDQFARASVYGRYKVIPLHAEIIAQCESIGFDYMGAIIWRKKTTMRTSGGAVIMGSFPYPPNGIVELDYEYILLFKKPGPSSSVKEEIKEASRLTRDEWKSFFSGHWSFAGERQVQHEAMFPEELPRRLIRMFTFVGETVLDPFLGSGTTVKVALELGRHAIGYEIQPNFEPIIRKKLGLKENTLFTVPVTIRHRQNFFPPVAPPSNYSPRIQDARPLTIGREVYRSEPTYRVVSILDEKTMCLDNDMIVELLGIIVPPERKDKAIAYLNRYVRGKRVYIKHDNNLRRLKNKNISAYLYLSNKLFINRKMIEMGLAIADRNIEHKYKTKFIKAESKQHG